MGNQTDKAYSCVQFHLVTEIARDCCDSEVFCLPYKYNTVEYLVTAEKNTDAEEF
jgi:hypothetical protein